jgi:ABC-type spermidine/putrescine transport system permease subunit I
MPLWVAISVSLACLIVGYCAACWLTDAAHQDLEQEIRLLENEVRRKERKV